ncbi:hypothetical protein Poli38472_004740 [Pythium oligandrum]|uniref:Uncharacterized protein n=1 Tax=Pythium oligandrum TaxID=41045 RepID=A0A8K1FEQ0_PYTOL|nr:hypothetical protein Poli38472_004740 [Pythium oligandrum]|eukprot:TMW59671.1 hypothetical protein Poli38472_004740 [Pythium oligandrum]
MHRQRYEARGVWTVSEHERFIEAMAMYPSGPWKTITEHVGTRSIKQVQTHAQKYQQKLMRHQRGLRKRKTRVKRPEHRVDEDTLDQFTHRCIVRYAQKAAVQAVMPGDSPSEVSTTYDFNLIGMTPDEWELLTSDISTDTEFMKLLEDADVQGSDEPTVDEILYPFGNEWNEWQFEELLQPEERMELQQSGYLDGAMLGDDDDDAEGKDVSILPVSL